MIYLIGLYLDTVFVKVASLVALLAQQILK
jgi:hypothetical protein